MSEGAGLRWDVRADQIDPDLWAQAIVKALASTNENPGKATRWGNWPAFIAVAALLLILSALTGSWVLFIALVPAVILIGVILALNRSTARRLAKQIRSTPSASEPFVFTADATGTCSVSTSGSDQLRWVRYRRIRLDEGLFLLTLDNNSVRVLPVAALSSGQSSADAVALLTTWIDGASTRTSGNSKPG